MELTDQDIASIAMFLSSERLATFHAIAGSTKDAILLHQQMLCFGTTLMSVTAVIEIATRNAICERISGQLGGGGWLRTPPPSLVWKPSELEKIKQAERSARKAAYSKKSQKQIVVADGQIIAQLTMFFWKRLFSADYEAFFWNRSLKRIFPDKSLKRTDISIHFEEIYQARNRIAHHEPIYDARLDKVLCAIDFIVRHFGKADATGKTPLCKLLDAELGVLRMEAQALTAKLKSFRGI